MIVLDDFAPIGLIHSAKATWLPEWSGLWHRYENGKLATRSAAQLPVAARILLEKMSEIQITEKIGVTIQAFPDIEYLHGAGLHQLPVGVELGLHVDSERHPTLPWRREASAVLYLDNCDGGEFELCDENGTAHQSVGCIENRLVLFATRGQWHRVREARSIRRSICLFFWSVDSACQGSDRSVFKT